MRPVPYTSSLLILLAVFLTVGRISAEPFNLRFTQPTMDRWMYPFNATPGCRSTAPTFGTLGEEAGVDSRHGQFLLGFDTLEQTVTNCGTVYHLSNLVPSQQGASRYLLRRVRLTVTVNRPDAFRYDNTQDAYTSYFQVGAPGQTDDEDVGRPIELFGVGYRNGYTVDSFWEDSPFGDSSAGARNAFAAGYGPLGLPIDVSNNVGKTNALFSPFEVFPFAIGQTDEVAPGQLVPGSTTFHFDLNLADPLVYQYVQEGLNQGRLRLMITSLHTSDLPGAPVGWPDFYTRDSVLGAPPTLDIEGTLVSSVDTDQDGLPDDWEQFYWGSLEKAGSTDSDADSATNLDEFLAGTDPTHPESVLKIRSLVRDSLGRVTLQFPDAPSRTYVIEFSEDLKGWVPILQPELIHYKAPGVVEWKDGVSQDAAQFAPRFYRIRIP